MEKYKSLQEGISVTVTESMKLIKKDIKCWYFQIYSCKDKSYILLFCDSCTSCSNTINIFNIKTIQKIACFKGKYNIYNVKTNMTVHTWAEKDNTNKNDKLDCEKHMVLNFTQRIVGNWVKLKAREVAFSERSISIDYPNPCGHSWKHTLNNIIWIQQFIHTHTHKRDYEFGGER